MTTMRGKERILQGIPGMHDPRKTMVPHVATEPPVIQEIVLHSCAVKVAEMPDGGKIARFVAPNGIAVTIPLDKNGVELVIARLRGEKESSLVVAPGGSIPGT